MSKPISRSPEGNVLIELGPAAVEALRRPVQGVGGFQSAIRRVQGMLSDGSTLVLREPDIQYLRKLAGSYRGGGFQNRLKDVLAALDGLEDAKPLVGASPCSVEQGSAKPDLLAPVRTGRGAVWDSPSPIQVEAGRPLDALLASLPAPANEHLIEAGRPRPTAEDEPRPLPRECGDLPLRELVHMLGSSVRLTNCARRYPWFSQMTVQKYLNGTGTSVPKMRNFGRVCLVELNHLVRQYALDTELPLPTASAPANEHLIEAGRPRPTAEDEPRPLPRECGDLLLRELVHLLGASARLTNSARRYPWFSQMTVQKYLNGTGTSVPKMRNFGRMCLVELNDLVAMFAQAGAEAAATQPLESGERREEDGEVLKNCLRQASILCALSRRTSSIGLAAVPRSGGPQTTASMPQHGSAQAYEQFLRAGALPWHRLNTGSEPDSPLSWAFLADSELATPITALATLVLAQGYKPSFVLDRRIDKTLAEIGKEIGVTRERVRQIEIKAARSLRPHLHFWAGSRAARWLRQLSSAAVSETELFSDIIIATLPAVPQYRLATLALRILFPKAHTPWLGAPRGVTRGWWTNSPKALGRTLRSIAKACPFSSEDFELYLRHAGISSDLLEPLRAQEHSSIRYHAGASAWVRSRAVHRDAATYILRQTGKPMASTELAGPLGINARAVAGNLFRDDRFRQLRPSREWALSEWLTDEQVRADLDTTLDAVVSVLRSDGPLKRTTLIGRVVEIYPVSAWSVMSTLQSNLVGLTADGRIDLIERGATPMPLRIPRRPDYVVVANGIVILRRRVEHEMLRGSGISIGPYLGWAVGLDRHGEARTFVSPGQPNLIVRRGLGTSSISSIRQQVTELKGSLGDTAAIELALSTDTYRIVIEK